VLTLAADLELTLFAFTAEPSSRSGGGVESAREMEPSNLIDLASDAADAVAASTTLEIDS